MCAEYGESAIYLVRHPRYANQRLSPSGLGPFAQRLRSIWTMPPFLLFVTDWIEPDTKRLSRPSVVSPLLVEPIQPSKTRLFFKIFMAASTNHRSLICCACRSNSPLLYAPVDPEISSSSLPLVARRLSSFFHRFFLSRTLRSFKLFHTSFRFLRQRALPSLQLLYYCPLFVRVCFSSLSGLLFTCYRCICFTPIPLLSKPVYFCRGIHTLSCLLPTSSAFARFRFFASRFICLNCVFNVGPYLDAYVGSLRLSVCVESFSLTS